MKKRVLVAAGAIVILILGIVIWNHIQTNKETESKMASIHELSDVLRYVEQKGTDYAADRLDYLITYSYTKDDLLKKWGTPNDSVADDEADVWKLSDENQLAVYYDTDGEVVKIEVHSSQN